MREVRSTNCRELLSRAHPSLNNCRFNCKNSKLPQIWQARASFNRYAQPCFLPDGVFASDRMEYWRAAPLTHASSAAAVQVAVAYPRAAALQPLFNDPGSKLRSLLRADQCLDEELVESAFYLG